MRKDLHATPGRARTVTPSVGVISTYPPTTCGLATFTSALVRHLRASDEAPQVRVVQVTDTPLSTVPAEVVEQLVTTVPGASTRAARALDGVDFAVLQHEYGIFGGPNGEDVLDLLAELTMPTVVVTHTVLSDPTVREQAVLSAVAEAADVVVAMTGVARDRLVGRYGVDPRKTMVIPHGAIVEARGRMPLSGGPPRLLTWGLLGPGKGIEWAIDALARLTDLVPRPHYLVAGQTHPKVREHHGEGYLSSLRQRVADHGLGGHVKFDGEYHAHASLLELVRDADLVVLPYESTEQVTSGVLVDAIACGRPVIASAFPHAVELLASGAGLVVPRRDPEALAGAVRRALTEPGMLRRMAQEAARLAPTMAWSSVADRYLDLGERLLVRRVA